MNSIFHIITTLNRGGAENQLLVLVREQVENGFDVHVTYLKGNPELRAELETSGATVHTELAEHSAIIQPLIFRRLIKGKSPIVHAHLPRAELVGALTPAHFKFFTSRHNSEPFFPGAPRIISNFLSRLVEFRATKIIAISEAVKNFLISQGEVSNLNKIEVILYGYRPILFRDAEIVRTGSKDLAIGTISRLTEQKDIPTLLRAFSDFREKGSNAHLYIVGDGKSAEELNALTQGLSLQDSVHFLGRSSQVMNFLMGLDVFVLTSKYEGFGMVLLEAMDARVPIVASRNSAIPEVLGEDFPGLCETGNFVEFSQKIASLQDENVRETYLNLQEKRLKFFSAQIMSKKVSETYSSLEK